jgi:hypothetical protein
MKRLDHNYFRKKVSILKAIQRNCEKELEKEEALINLLKAVYEEGLMSKGCGSDCKCNK